MALNSTKKQALANSATLKELRLISLVVNGLVLLAILLFKRPSSIWPYMVLSMPAWGLQYLLEKSGRPKYTIDRMYPDRPVLISCGDDIKRPGIFEYYFDIIYVTWLIDIFMIAFGTNKVWHIYWVVPGYALFKVWRFAKLLLPQFLRNRGPRNGSGEPHVDQSESATSKRRAKLEARQKKVLV